MKRVEKLYECRACGGLVATKGLSCPYCDASDGGTTTVRDLETGEPTEKTRSWYEPVKLGVTALAE